MGVTTLVTCLMLFTLHFHMNYAYSLFHAFFCLFPHSVSASVTANPVSSTVAEGSMAEFTFTVTGNPLPTVEWYKGTIGDDYRINLSPSQLESSKKSIEACYWILAHPGTHSSTAFGIDTVHYWTCTCSYSVWSWRFVWVEQTFHSSLFSCSSALVCLAVMTR